jgi:prepilin-type N-terminal cleavage/methylation domain-containing protein
MRKRHGFTLVELLVAMALIIFIMSILSYAFVAATTAFRDLKAAGDLAERLRSTTTLLQRDLAADHFEGRRRLSDPTFWSNGPPRQGFFRIWQGNSGTRDGNVNDLDGIPLYRSTDHALHFTVHLRGNRPTDFFTAKVPGNAASGNTFVAPDPRCPSPLLTSATLGPLTARYEDLDQNRSTFNSQWAEVVYFLRPALDNSGNQETANGTPLFTLYRRQLLLVSDNNLVQTGPSGLASITPSTNTAIDPYQPTPYLEVSCWQGYPPGAAVVNIPSTLYFNSPFDVTVPQRRFGMDYKGQPVNTNNQQAYPTLAEHTTDTNMQAADVLMTDVVSFDVRVLLSNAFTDPNITPLPFQLAECDPFVDLFHPSMQAFNTPPSSSPGVGNNALYPGPGAPPGGLTSWWPPPATTSPLYNTKYVPPNGPQVFDTWTSVRDPLASILAAQPPALSQYAPLYDYSTWGQPGTAANPSAVSMPLWSNASGTGPRIMAIQVQLRIWDSKTQQTRQVTLVQAM